MDGSNPCPTLGGGRRDGAAPQTKILPTATALQNPGYAYAESPPPSYRTVTSTPCPLQQKTLYLKKPVTFCWPRAASLELIANLR